MAFEKFPPTNASEAVAVFKQDVIIVHDVAHGSDDAEVLTENGLIPSIAKFIKDANLRIDSGISGLDHQVLGNRTSVDSHPIAAITGLQTALDGKVEPSDLATVATTGNYSDLLGKPSSDFLRITATGNLSLGQPNIIDGTGLIIAAPSGTVDGESLVFTWEFGSSFTLTGAFQTSLGDDTSIIIADTDKSALVTLVWDSAALKWSL